jgi:SecD/SecF fusion protein
MTMRPFFWRIVICLTPVLLASLVTWRAYVNDGFKLGVDLSGGTILVYEIDTRKQQERMKDDEKGAARSDPQADTNLLADALKRRIDPTATYNIVIRPAGAGGRVEIIIPTGGQKRGQKAQEKWEALLQKMKDEWQLKELEVSRGRTQELVDRIQTQVTQRTWTEKVFNTPEAWKELIDNTEKQWKQLAKVLIEPGQAAAFLGLQNSAVQTRSLAAFAALQPKAFSYLQPTRDPADKLLRQLKPGDLKGFQEIITSEFEREEYVPNPSVGTWIKEQAWKKLLERIRQDKRWSNITKEDLEGIAPDSFEELIGRVEAGGNLFIQGALETLRPLLDRHPVDKGLNDRKQIQEFIEGKIDPATNKYVEGNFGPSATMIENAIKELTGKEEGASRDLTVEEVQRIKELVARVGSLEFRILANQHDDKQAIADAKDQIADKNNDDDLKQAAIRGEAPKGPTVASPPSKNKLKEYTIDLPNNNKSTVTYSWVELGPQERHAMGLDNAARNDEERGRKKNWDYVHSHLGQAIQIPDPGSENRFMMQGALFYAREVKDRNMPEDQKRKKQYEYFVLARNPEIDPATGKETPRIDGTLLRGAQVDTTGGRPVVNFTFKEAGGRLFGTLTGKNVPSGAGAEESKIRRHLAIVLDGLVMSAPTINSRIEYSGQITGDFTRKQVDSLVNILRSGALPATLKTQPVSETTIGATLGEDTIREGVNAIMIAFAAVVVFMILYYRFAGMVASVALLANLILTVGFMVFVQATFTLPGLAGLVLTLGMAVDANVLIYERFREERDRGASLALAIRNGYDRAFATIIDTHMTGIFTAIVLYVVGNDQLKGFGVSLTVGLIISLFTSLYMTRLMFDLWLARGWLRKLSMGRLLAKPDIDFMGIRYYCFTFTVVLTILGVTVFVARLPSDLNIDFVGGTAYTAQLVEKSGGKTMTELRDLLNEERQKEMLQVVSVKQQDQDGHKFSIVYRDPDGKQETRDVMLANVPNGNSTAEREESVKVRAAELPEQSVEQLFPSTLPKEMRDAGKSTWFNVRTSEKETELVQAALDRLLREKVGNEYKPLMKKIGMELTPKDSLVKGREVKLSFHEHDQASVPAYASQSFVTTLLTRELLQSFFPNPVPPGEQPKTRRDLTFQFEVTGEGKTEEGGRFQNMKVTFTDLKGDNQPKVLAALARTKQAFEDRPAPERLENFDPEMAQQIRLQAMWAILASWLAIAAYLWFRFGNWTFGLAAVLCLIHDLFFTLGMIAFCHYIHQWWPGFLGIEDFKIDLTAVAALLTLVGYSVSDTIVVFDRIREVRGKNPDLTPEMINDSVNQTLSRTILTAFTVWLVVFVLYVIGGPGVHLFGFVMVIGVIVGTYSSIYVASPLLLIFGEGTRSKALGIRRAQPAGVTP